MRAHVRVYVECICICEASTQQCTVATDKKMNHSKVATDPRMNFFGQSLLCSAMWRVHYGVATVSRID